MRVTICEFPDEHDAKEQAWAALADYLARVNPSIVVLPEMPFCDWIFDRETVDRSVWQKAVDEHEVMMPRLGELTCRWVMSSRPIEEGGRRFNEAFLWSAQEGYRPVRRKWYLPDAPTARETRWFNRGDRNFVPVMADAVATAFQLCSEIMFTHHARDIGFGGAHLIVQPRATGGASRWLIASEMSAIASGSYVASANRRSLRRELFSGRGWLLSPEGHILCETTEEKPFATADIDPATAERAKLRYPRDLYRMYRD